MTTRISLYADAVDWPLWNADGGPLSEGDLPLSEALVTRIKAWFNAYEGSPFEDWPLWRAPDGEDEEEAWVAEGEWIRDALTKELGESYEVSFDA